MFNITCEPQPGMNGRTYSLLAANVVGGGTVVNGMAFDRGSAGDYDLWEDMGNPGWGWDGLLPYFKKVSFPSKQIPIRKNKTKKLTIVNRVKPIHTHRQTLYQHMEPSLIRQHMDTLVLSILLCQHSSSLPLVSAHTSCYMSGVGRVRFSGAGRLILS